ncbi:MAG: domain containing protein [Pedosphaera sp.]|nr:domain containing protein [Pedosphaera sp.]
MLLAVAALLVVGGLALHPARNREPRYQGRTLTEWLEAYHQSWSWQAATNAPPKLEASTYAVRQIGTDAIPFLLRKLTSKESSMEKHLKPWAKMQSLIQFRFTDHDHERWLGVNGFEILLVDARSAVPALVKLTKHPDGEVRTAALDCLGSINQMSDACLPIFIRAAHDPAKCVRAVSANILSKLYPEEAEKADVYKEFPGLRYSSTNHVSVNAPVAR